MTLLENLRKNRTLQLLLLLILIGTIIRFSFIGAPSIREDEGGTIFLASRSVGVLVDNLKSDVHPPLYYLSMHFWSSLGKSELALRAFSALLGVLSIPLIFILGKRLFNARVGLFSSAILAFSQFHLRYAQTLRSYTLAVFLVLLSTYFFVAYLQENKLKHLLLYVFASAFCLYTHYYTALVLIAQNIYFFINYRKYKQIFKKWILSQAGILLLFSFWLPTFYMQISNPSPNAYGVISEQINLFQFNANNLFIRLAMILFHMSVGYLKASFSNPFFLLVLITTIILFSVSLFNLKNSVKEDRSKVFLVLALFLIPLLIMIPLWYSGLTVRLLYARYLVFFSPFYYLLVAKGIDSLKPLRFLSKINWKLVFVILILAFNMCSMYAYFRYDNQRENIRQAAGFVKSNAGAGDIVALYDSQLAFHFKYYLGYDHPLVLFPSNIDASDINTLSVRSVHEARIPITSENSCSGVNLAKGSSFWFIYSSNQQEACSGECLLVKRCFEDSGYTVEKELVTSWQDLYGASTEDFSVLYFKK